MGLAVFHFQKFWGEFSGRQRGRQRFAPLPSYGRNGHHEELFPLAKNFAQMYADLLQQAALNDRLVRTRRHGNGYPDHDFAIITEPDNAPSRRRLSCVVTFSSMERAPAE